MQRNINGELKVNYSLPKKSDLNELLEVINSLKDKHEITINVYYGNYVSIKINGDKNKVSDVAKLFL